MMNSLRLSLCAAALALAGCDTTSDLAPGPNRALLPEDSVQRLASDGRAEFQRIMEAYPQATALALLDRRGKGLVVHRNGSIVLLPFGSNINSDLQIRSRVASADGNVLCLESEGSWTGGCFTITPAADAKLTMDIEFGTGAKRTETVTPYVLLAAADA